MVTLDTEKSDMKREEQVLRKYAELLSQEQMHRKYAELLSEEQIEEQLGRKYAELLLKNNKADSKEKYRVAKDIMKESGTDMDRMEDKVLYAKSTEEAVREVLERQEEMVVEEIQMEM